MNIRLLPFRIAGLTLLLAASFPCLAQPSTGPGPQTASPETEIQAVLQRLFDGMRAGDSTAVRSVFAPAARLGTIVLQDGEPTFREGDLDRFVTAVGTPHADVWDERLYNSVYQVDGPMATAWTPYVFYLGDTLSHCGVNAFQLFKSPDGWLIINLTDTRRQDACPVETP